MGFTTSVCEGDGDKTVALGYLKMYLSREVFAAEGQTVSVRGTAAEAVVRPANYARYPEQQEVEEEAEAPEEDAEEEAKRKKKAEMKARMEEWLKQSKETT